MNAIFNFDGCQVRFAMRVGFGLTIIPKSWAYRSDSTGRRTSDPIRVGDVAAIKERWSPDHADFYPHYPIVYDADDLVPENDIVDGCVFSAEAGKRFPFKWRQASGMPLCHCRLKIVLDSIKPVNVNELSDHEAIMYGIETRKRIDDPEASVFLSSVKIGRKGDSIKERSFDTPKEALIDSLKFKYELATKMKPEDFLAISYNVKKK